MNKILPELSLLQEAERILQNSKEKGVILRLIGATAFRLHCREYGWIQEKLGRTLSDIDFVGYSNQSNRIRKLFQDLGYEERGMINVLLSKERLVFYDISQGKHVDVFLDKLRFNHIINLIGRLEIDYPTISLVDLLLEKIQIVKITQKDIIDVIMLLREHKVGLGNQETIDAGYLAKLCSDDWGLWKTTTMNLQKIQEFLNMLDLPDEDKEDVRLKIQSLLSYINEEPKTFKWKMRSKIGEKKKWYEDVEELER